MGGPVVIRRHHRDPEGLSGQRWNCGWRRLEIMVPAWLLSLAACVKPGFMVAGVSGLSGELRYRHQLPGHLRRGAGVPGQG